jgi:hypothetical protein
MKRNQFLIGMLFGLVLGVCTAMLANAIHSPGGVQAPLSPTPTVPVWRVDGQGCQVPDDKSIPRGWQKRYFNGQPYYIVPLVDRVPV